MGLGFRIVNASIKNIIQVICRVQADDLKKVPAQGPLILVTNHVNFLEIPLLFTFIQPRPVTGLAKVETWQNPVLGPLFNLWDAIPIDRGTGDRSAFKAALKALSEGRIVAVAPEGTRSGNGQLRRGLPGVVALAARSRAPVLPLAFWGGEAVWDNFRRLRRTEFNIAVGKPFTIDIPSKMIEKQVREAAVDEIMLELARLLPNQYHGYYQGTLSLPSQYLRFA
jgi:1-acyl-sn-glycerol-3-phosphate acyltransferase